MGSYDLAYVFSAPLVVRRKDKVRMIPQLDVETERDILRAAVRRAGRRFRYIEKVATISSVSELFSRGLRALHYSGHGVPSGVTFEKGLSRDGDPTRAAELYVVKGKELQKLLEASHATKHLKFVFVSACFSESVGQCFVDAGVDHVVAIDSDYGVRDTAAKVFASSLYSALLLRKTVREAFDIAVQTVRMEPSLFRRGKMEAAKFKLLPEFESTNHEVVIFDDLPLPSTEHGAALCSSLTERPTYNTVPSPVAHFRCRELTMNLIIASMMRSPSVVNGSHRGVLLLRGVAGVGKSEVARKVTRWFHERAHFTKLYFVDGAELSDTPRIMQRSIAPASCATRRHVCDRALRYYFAKALDLHRGGSEDADSEKDIASKLGESADRLALLAESEEFFFQQLSTRFSDTTTEYFFLVDNADAMIASLERCVHRGAQQYFADFVMDIARRRAPALTVMVTARSDVLAGGLGYAVIDVLPLVGADAGDLMMSMLPSAVVQWLHDDDRRFLFKPRGDADEETHDVCDSHSDWSARILSRMTNRETSANDRRKLQCECLAQGPYGQCCGGLPALVYLLRGIIDCCDGDDIGTLYDQRTIARFKLTVEKHYAFALVPECQHLSKVNALVKQNSSQHQRFALPALPSGDTTVRRLDKDAQLKYSTLQSTFTATDVVSVRAHLTVSEDAEEWLRLSNGKSSLGWSVLQVAIQRRFERLVLSGTPGGLKRRKLSLSDFSALETYTQRHSCGSLVSKLSSKNGSERKCVAVAAWARFLYTWFQPWMTLIKFILPAWNTYVRRGNCAFIEGFVSTATVNAAMQSRGVGCFLLRFSATQPRAISVVYHDAATISMTPYGAPPVPRQSLLTLTSDPEGRPRLILKGKPARYFSSLGAVFESRTLPVALTHLCVGEHGDVPTNEVLREWRSSCRLVDFNCGESTHVALPPAGIQSGPVITAVRASPRPARLSRFPSKP